MLTVFDDPPLNRLLFVGIGGYVFALDMGSGREIWNTTLKGTGFGNPTLIIPDPIESNLVVTSGANLKCISAVSGIELWENKLTGIGVGYPSITQGRDTAKFNSYTSTRDPYPKTPSYTASKFDPEDLVYVASNFVVRAISIQSGSEVWSHSTPAGEGYSTKPFLLVENGTLFVAGNGRIYALNALTGLEIWKADVKHRHICTLATMASGNATENIPYNRHHVSSTSKPKLTDAIFFGAAGYINAISKETGKRFPLPPSNGEITLTGTGIRSPDLIPLANSELLLAAGGINLRLYDLKSGSLLWENRLQGMGIGVLSVLAGSGVSLNNGLSGSNDDDLPDYSIEASPVGSGSGGSSSSVLPDSLSRVVYISLSGQVRAIRMTDGKELWCYNPSFMQRSLIPNVFFEDDRVFVAGSGLVAALDGKTGQMIWCEKTIRSGGPAFIGSIRSGNGETNRTSLFGNVYKRRLDDD